MDFPNGHSGTMLGYGDSHEQNSSRANQGPKRQRVSFEAATPHAFDESALGSGHEEIVENTRSRSPLRVKRSTSLHIPNETCFTSPKRSDFGNFDPCFYSKPGKKLQRSLSLSELTGGPSQGSRRSLQDRMAGGPFLEASSLEGSSAGSDVDLSRHNEEESLARWTKESMAAQRDSPYTLRETLHEEGSPLMLSLASPLVLSSFVAASSDQQADMVIDKMSTLGVSASCASLSSSRAGYPSTLTMMPPSLLSSTLFPAVRVLGGAPLGAFETPTREQSLLMYCSQLDVSDVVTACRSKIKLAVFDLDETMLDIHTKGKWKMSGRSLAERHVRPVFRVLIPHLLRAGIPVGIATFSGQEELIEELVMHSFPADARVEDNFFVRGSREGDRHTSTQECLDELGDEDGMDDHTECGKRKHIKCILDRLPNGTGASIAPSEILFVDDDEVNTTAAQKDGHRTVRFQGTWTDEVVLSRIMRVLAPA